jgi:hypothetical protein
MSTKCTADYMRQWRADLKTARCDCGEKAVVTSQGYKICARCRDLETLAAQYAFRRAHFRRVLLDEAMPPRPVRSFVARVWEAAGELVVCGHGEYHLSLRG